MSQLQRLVIAPTQCKNGKICLTPQQQHYLERVLRLQTGDRFVAMNGRGNSWLCTLEDTLTATIGEPIFGQAELPVDVVLMAALPKGNGFDEIVRCCTELGVNCIVPVISDRTLLKPSSQKLARWRRIATEAAEQSEREIVPIIDEPISLSKSLQTATSACRYLCVARSNAPHLLDCHSNREIVDSQIAIATGPEGGWTPGEVKEAIACGFQPVSLGRRILRSVTAPIVALSLVAAILDSIFELSRGEGDQR